MIKSLKKLRTEEKYPTTHGTVPAHLSKTKNVSSPTEGRKVVTCYSEGDAKRPASPRYTQRPSAPHLTLLGESPCSSSKSWNPVPSLREGKHHSKNLALACGVRFQA
jgi:hypothetical protein